MSADEHARAASAEKLEANNASAINLLQDESIFNDAEVLLYSQPKNGKQGDERVFQEHLDENSETGNEKLKVLTAFQMLNQSSQMMGVTHHDFANNSQTDMMSHSKFDYQQEGKHFDQNLDVQMPDKVHGDLDMVEDSIFQQSLVEHNLLSNRHIVSVKTKGQSKQQQPDKKAPKKHTMADRIVKHLTMKKMQESQAFLEQEALMMKGEEKDSSAIVQSLMKSMKKLKRQKSLSKKHNILDVDEKGNQIEDSDEQPEPMKWIKVSDEEMKTKHGALSLSRGKEEQELEESHSNKICPPKRKPVIKKNADNVYSVEEVEEIDQLLFIRLQKEKQARFNWRKIMTMISIVKHLSERESKEFLQKRLEKNAQDQDKRASCWTFQWADKYLRSPDSKIMTIWTLLALSMNTVSIFIVYYEAAFQLTAWEKEASWVLVIEFILLLEIIIFFFKAYPAMEEHRGWWFSVFGICGCCKEASEDSQKVGKIGAVEDMWESSFRKVAIHYISGSFLTDFLSVVPFLFGKLASSEPNYRIALQPTYMQIFAYLRLLRITQLPKILSATDTYAAILMKRFPSLRQVIYNSKQILSLVLFLFLSLHLAACLNIYQGMTGWIEQDDQGVPVESPSDIYVSQGYFMTTTMTTIGYGDFNAAKHGDGYNKPDNMALVCFLQVMAIFTFSLIQDRLFSLHFDIKIKDIVAKSIAETEYFTQQLDQVQKRQYDHKKLNLEKGYKQPERKYFDDQLRDDLIQTMETSSQHSCYDAFIRQPFFSQMPPRLQDKLIQACLDPLEKKFEHFFRELGTHQLAPRGFICRLLANLSCFMVRIGDTIHKEGNVFEKVYFFSKHRGVISRNFTSKAYGNIQLDVAELPEGSFIGELEVTLGTNSYFNLKTGENKRKDQDPTANNNMAMIYSINAEPFKELCKDYPEFSYHVYIRSEIRLAYFKYLAHMKQGEFSYNMKIIELEKEMEIANTTLVFDEDANQNNQDDKIFNKARDKAKYVIATQLVRLQDTLSKIYGQSFCEEAMSAFLSRITIMHHGIREVDPTDTGDQYLLLKNTTYHSNLVRQIGQDDFDYASLCYLMRRSRRIFLQSHNIVQIIRTIDKRWNKFASNTVGLIKNEVSIQDESNFGEFGLQPEQLFTISQLSFKRRQQFVINALAHREKYEVTFGESVDSKSKDLKEYKLLLSGSQETLSQSNSASAITQQQNSRDDQENMVNHFVKQLRRYQNRKFERMTCFARFKYHESKPAFRVHIWDIFDAANEKTKDFYSMFDQIEYRMAEMYEEQGFDSDDEEKVLGNQEAEYENASDDSANADLIEQIYKITRKNVFNDSTDGSKIDSGSGSHSGSASRGQKKANSNAEVNEMTQGSVLSDYLEHDPITIIEEKEGESAKVTNSPSKKSQQSMSERRLGQNLYVPGLSQQQNSSSTKKFNYKGSKQNYQTSKQMRSRKRFKQEKKPVSTNEVNPNQKSTEKVKNLNLSEIPGFVQNTRKQPTAQIMSPQKTTDDYTPINLGPLTAKSDKMWVNQVKNPSLQTKKRSFSLVSRSKEINIAAESSNQNSHRGDKLMQQFKPQDSNLTEGGAQTPWASGNNVDVLKSMMTERSATAVPGAGRQLAKERQNQWLQGRDPIDKQASKTIQGNNL